MGRMLYADDLAVLLLRQQVMQEVLGEWKEAFGKHGLRMRMEKNEVLWVGQQRKYMNIRLEGNLNRQENRFEYLGGTVTRDGKSEAEVWRRIQVGANAWRRVEGGMADKIISRKLKRMVLMLCVIQWPGDGGTDRETTTEAAGLREQLDQEDCGSEEGGWMN